MSKKEDILRLLDFGGEDASTGFVSVNEDGAYEPRIKGVINRYDRITNEVKRLIYDMIQQTGKRYVLFNENPYVEWTYLGYQFCGVYLKEDDTVRVVLTPTIKMNQKVVSLIEECRVFDMLEDNLYNNFNTYCAIVDTFVYKDIQTLLYLILNSI